MIPNQNQFARVKKLKGKMLWQNKGFGLSLLRSQFKQKKILFKFWRNTI